MIRLIIIIAAAIGIWNGADGLWVNITSGSLTTFDIRTVEKHGIGNNRYIKITGGTWGSSYTYQVNEKSDDVHYIIYSLQSPETYSNIIDGKNATVHVIVKKPAYIPANNLDKWTTANGSDDDEVEAQGVTLVGLDSISSGHIDLIESMNITVSDSVIFLEEGTEPRSIITNLLMLIISSLIIYLLMRSWFSEDYE